MFAGAKRAAATAATTAREAEAPAAGEAPPATGEAEAPAAEAPPASGEAQALPSRPPGNKRREPEEAAGGSPLPAGKELKSAAAGRPLQSAAVGRPFQRPRVTVKSGALAPSGAGKAAALIEARCTVCGVRDEDGDLLTCGSCRKSLCAGCKVACQAAASCKRVSCPGCMRTPRCGRTDIVCCEGCWGVECADCDRCAFFSRCAGDCTY
jgi:hypothetical protein